MTSSVGGAAKTATSSARRSVRTPSTPRRSTSSRPSLTGRTAPATSTSASRPGTPDRSWSPSQLIGRCRRLPLVDLALGGVVAPARDQRAAARKPPGGVEHRALVLVPDRDLARPPALRPRRLDPHPIAAVRVGGRELDRLLAPQPERRLELERHPHVRIGHPRELLRIEPPAPILVGDVAPLPDPVRRVGARHPRVPDPLRLPAKRRHAVLHGPGREPPALPLGDEHVDVLALQPRRPQPPEPERVQQVRRLVERVGPVPARDERALAVPRLQGLKACATLASVSKEVAASRDKLPGALLARSPGGTYLRTSSSASRIPRYHLRESAPAHRVSPSFATLRRYAEATGMRLTVGLVRDDGQGTRHRSSSPG